MSKQQSLPETPLSRLPALRECPLCTTGYLPEDVVILRKDGDERLIHLTCHACSGCVLATIVTSSIGMNVIGVVTDLTARDAAHFAGRKPVASDDILAFHTLLGKHTLFESLLSSSVS